MSHSGGVSLAHHEALPSTLPSMDSTDRCRFMTVILELVHANAVAQLDAR